MKQYLDLFASCQAQLEAQAPAFLNARREQAASSLQRMGMPKRSDEDYRYTDVSAALQPDYGMRIGTTGLTHLDAEVQVAAEEVYATVAPTDSDQIVALNTLLAQDIVVLHAKPKEKLRRQLRLNNPPRTGQAVMAHRRVLILADEGSHVCVGIDDMLPSHAAQAAALEPMMTTLVVEVVARKGATVEVYECERTDSVNRRFATLAANLHEGAQLTHAAMTLTSGISRNKIHVRLLGEGAACTLLGGTVEFASQHVDSNTLIEHLAPRCTSSQLYRYVLDQDSQGAFAGRIYVAEGAVGTESEETNANLVCTPQARMFTQPMLEIYADDVKCSHGATIGQLSADALFYMQQRGLHIDEARSLLKQAFAAQVVARIPDTTTRERYASLLQQHFAAQSTLCPTCQRCS